MIFKKKEEKIERIKVHNGFTSFWVSNPKKIEFYNNLDNSPGMQIRVVETVKSN